MILHNEFRSQKGQYKYMDHETMEYGTSYPWYRTQIKFGTKLLLQITDEIAKHKIKNPP